MPFKRACTVQCTRIVIRSRGNSVKCKFIFPCVTWRWEMMIRADTLPANGPASRHRLFFFFFASWTAFHWNSNLWGDTSGRFHSGRKSRFGGRWRASSVPRMEAESLPVSATLVNWMAGPFIRLCKKFPSPWCLATRGHQGRNFATR